MPHRKESMKRRIAWGALAVLSIAALAWSVISGIERREYVACSVGQTDLIITYLDETRQAAAEEREAHDLVRRAQLDGDKAAERVAIVQYFEIRRQSDARRANAKLPPLPETVCGEPRP